MPVKNRFAELLPEITAWRRDFHEHPELLFDVHRTAARVAALCRDFGCHRTDGRPLCVQDAGQDARLRP